MCMDTEYNPIIDNLEKLPPLLYKYRTFDNDGHGISMAKNGEVYFPSASQLNDPFETYFIPESKFPDLPENELKEYIKSKTRQYYSHLDPESQKKLNEIALKRAKIHRENPYKAAEELLELQDKKFGILSLVKKRDSLPMWAYYSNNHQGMCIGLKTQVIAEQQIKLIEETKQLMLLHDVIYTNNIPHVNIDLPLEEESSIEKSEEEEKVHYTKSSQWEHEEEIRLIYWEHTNESFLFGTRSIGEIIVGMEAHDENVELLLNELREVDSQANVLQASKSPHQFGLDFDEISF